MATPDPRSLDPTNVPRPVMLIARPEPDGTYTLILDCPQSDSLPTELGGGFRSLDDVKFAVIQSLTAPAVAEQRMETVEEAAAIVNQLVDAVNDLTNQVGNLRTQLGWCEDQIAEIQGRRTQMSAAQPGRIPRLGERRPGVSGAGDPRIHPRGQYYDQRTVWDEQARRGLPEEVFTGDAHRRDWTGFNQSPPRMPPRAAQPPQEPRSTRETGERAPGEKRDLTVREGARPSFDRGSFVPHEPIGRVARGPGTPD